MINDEKMGNYFTLEPLYKNIQNNKCFVVM